MGVGEEGCSCFWAYLGQLMQGVEFLWFEIPNFVYVLCHVRYPILLISVNIFPVVSVSLNRTDAL